MGIEDILRLLRRFYGTWKIWEGGVLGVRVALSNICCSDDDELWEWDVVFTETL